MKITEYLRGKYRRNTTIAMSDDEAVVLGIPVPPERGWPEKYGNNDVSLETAKKLMALMTGTLQRAHSPRRKANAQWAIETIRLHFGRDADINFSLEETSPLELLSRKQKRRRRLEGRRARRQEPRKKNQFWQSKPNMDAFLDSYEWRRVRMKVLQRDGRKCACCGATPDDGVKMHVDHIKPRKTHPSLALDMNNLQVLCEVCNHGKGNWDSTDWRRKEAVNDG